jgi:membrane-bound serine protease (ClpP class)
MMNAQTVARILIAITLTAMSGWVVAAPAPAPVMVLTVDGAITPASADYAGRGIARATRDGAQLVVLKIDTPGGLDTSMRTVIKAILASPVPVAAYVAPSGARAASAGTYILYASHIAAMAPGTNLGAATPVQLGAPSGQEPGKPAQKDKKDGLDDKAPAEMPTQQPMTRKQVNDAAAYIRGLAQMRRRNAEWAEQAVREAVSLSADEALKLRVIDIVAADVPALLRQVDGRKLNLQGQEKVLATADAPIVAYEPDWRVKLLAVITDPSIALLLLAIGVYGLLFEFMSPGMVLPGVLGAICLLLALYALQLLPVNYAGLALIVLGIAFMVSEAFLPSFGALGLGGVAAFIIGAVILIDTELPGFGIPTALIVGVAVVSGLLIATITSVALKTRRRTVVIGERDMVGAVAEVVEANDGGGWARIHGENWRVVSKTPLWPGQKVRVLARNGLVLEVAPVGNHATGE